MVFRGWYTKVLTADCMQSTSVLRRGLGTCLQVLRLSLVPLANALFQGNYDIIILKF